MPLVEKSDPVKAALKSNLESALSLGIMLNFKKGLVGEGLCMHDLLTTVVGLSYKGDLRMRMKMESANKVGNIVDGNTAQLTQLYSHTLMAM